MIEFPPGLILVLGAFVLPLLGRGPVMRAFSLLLPLATLAAVWMVPADAQVTWSFLDLELRPLVWNAPTRVFATIFSLMAFGGALFALNQDRRVELPAAFLYAGSAVCVTFAGDILTLFMYWELMAIGSTVVVWSAGTPEAAKAGQRYVAVHLIGGVVLMAGVLAHVFALKHGGVADPIALRYFEFGRAGFDALSFAGAGDIAPWLILIGVLINAATPPLGSWLADAYPEASESGTVFLSAFTTKTAVYVLMILFAGTELLIYAGMLMAVYGIVYAILENDMRRILAYSIVNQVGFMVCGIGIGTEMALNGAAAHAFAHIIYKALLLMSAGSVLYMTGKRKCTDLGGLYHTMPVTMWCGIIGALAISSFPWTSGFVSKSMISQAAADGHLFLPWMVLTAASAGVFLHAGIKFPWFVFFQKDSGLRPKDPPWNMKAAMLLFAFLCVALGLGYQPLYDILPYPAAGPEPLYEPYSASHIVSQLQLLLWSGLAFFLLLPILKRTLTITLDFDWFYRAFFPGLWRRVFKPIVDLLVNLRDLFFDECIKVGRAVTQADALAAQIPIFREWSLGSAMVLTTFVLFVYLIVGFLH